MDVLCITKSFFPHGDASSGVVDALSNALIDKGAQVTVLALTEYKDDLNIKYWGSINTRFYYDAYIRNIAQIKKDFRKDPINNGILIARKIINNIKLRYISAYSKLSINPVLLKDYRRMIREAIRNKEYDLCIVTLMPHEAVIAAFEIMKEKVPIVIYQLDTYWNNMMFPVEKTDSRFEFEKKLIERSLFTVTTPQAYLRTVSKCKALSNKLISAEFPLIKERRMECNGIKRKDGIIHCVFLGRLYRDIRPPEKIVKILSHLSTPNVIVDFYGIGQELIIQSEYYQMAKDKIQLNGIVSSEKACAIRDSADVLVNIDNTSIQQVPSKIFEYICTGKPIINFYFDEHSDVIKYLASYPSAININVNDENAPQFVDEFIGGITEKAIPFTLIREAYIKNTPEYVANQLLEAYQKLSYDTCDDNSFS